MTKQEQITILRNCFDDDEDLPKRIKDAICKEDSFCLAFSHEWLLTDQEATDIFRDLIPNSNYIVKNLGYMLVVKEMIAA